MKEKSNQFFAGQLINVDSYEAYMPKTVNHPFRFQDNKTLLLLEQASASLGKLNYLCDKLPSSMYISMLILLEALSSSAIEGTHASADEVISSDKKNADIQEVNNLFDTINTFYDSKNPTTDITSVKIIEDINKHLLSNTSRERVGVGKIRKGQNFVGGTSELSAAFVPPPAKYVRDLLQDLDDFWKNKSLYIPSLIKIAIYHYQFETIHPFNDGNGRTGRILINLQLKESGLLNFPVLCLSEYWGRNKGLYYEALTTVRFSHNIEYWIRFFLESIIKTSEERIDVISQIETIQNKNIKLIEEKIKNPIKHRELFDKLLKYPKVTVNETERSLKVKYQVANKIIQDLVKLNILKTENENKRNRVFIFKEYSDLIFKSIP